MANRRTVIHFVALIAAIGTAACGGYDWRRELRARASYQHDCPESQVQIISDNGNEMARQARVEVCGRTRVYEHENLGATYEWRDVTNGGDDAATNPPSAPPP